MIEIKNVYKSYTMTEQGLVVLKDVSLNIEPGEFVSIMGPSGSGKSTLLNIIGLLDVPDSGSYKIYGHEVTELRDDDLAILRRRVFGFVFQQFNLLQKMTALQNVELPLLYSKGQLNVNTAKGLLDKVGLSERIQHKPQQLSGGQQQRVAIARSLINGPKIVLADEPTGNLDSSSGKEILQMLKGLNEQGITVILVTHEESIAKQADRLIRIHDGQIVSDEKLNKGTKNSKNGAADFSMTAPSPFSVAEFTEHFKEGIKTLMANKVRTALSVLGILIGVAAVIAMLALGTGAKMAVEKELSSLGSNMLVLRSGSTRMMGGGVVEGGSVVRFTLDDVSTVKEAIPYIKEASPVVSGKAQTTYQDKDWSTQIIGAGPSYSSMHSLYPERGRFFTDDENRTRSRVALIGVTVLRELFGENSDPLGAFIKINKVSFQIIGVLPERGASGPRDNDDVVVIPCLTAMYRLLGKDHVDYIEMEVDSPENIDAVQESVSEMVIKQHKIPFSRQKDAFQIRNLAEMQNAMSETSRILSMLLTAIAAVSLLVGGIGIMNIMLVSVTERTKEIGLRKAIGARSVDILSQFVTEAGVIGIFGGIVGIVLGVLITFVMSKLAGWTTYISTSSIFLSFVFSVGVGVIFGIWPAKKASKLNPIEALRHE